MRLAGVVLACLGLIAAATGCAAPVGTPRPSPSLIVLDFTPPPSASTATTTATPIAAVWPVGWDIDFCAMFNEAVIAQQLVVDIERALDEGNRHDARLLADELIATANNATELLVALPAWPEADETGTAIAALMDLATQTGNEYHDYFTNDKRAALRRARDLRRQDADQVPPTNEQLGALAELGLACPGTDLLLESP
jgi:hypothetical protein